ncbi:MAG: sulfatase [Phycisphaerae bacterium]
MPQIANLSLLMISLAMLLTGCNPPAGGASAASNPQSPPAAADKSKIGLLPAGSKRPNVLVVVVDTLRFDRTGAYGHKGGYTPTVDALAAEGMVFERAQTVAPWTLPSIGSMFTAHYPSVHRAISYEQVREMSKGRAMTVPIIADEFTMWAEVMRDAGYSTVAISGNPFVQAPYGFGQGFEAFLGKEYADNTAVGTKVNADVFAWLDAYKGEKPFFMYLHYMDAHGPYDAPRQFMEPMLAKVEVNPNKRALTQREAQKVIPYLRLVLPDVPDAKAVDERLRGYLDYWTGRYDAGVQEFDTYFKSLVDDLKKRGLWDNTFVIFTADHGESFLEHGEWDHGYTLYQPEIQVPLIFRWPGVIPAGTRIKETVRLLDLYPTVIEQLRIKQTATLQGASMLDTMSGNPPKQPVVAFSETTKTSGPRKNNPQFAVVVGDWKLVQTVRVAQNAKGQWEPVLTNNELFDLSKDPYEQNDLSRTNPKKVEELARIMLEQNTINAKTKPGLVTQKATGDASKFGGLGYVGDAGEEEDEPTSQPASRP